MADVDQGQGQGQDANSQNQRPYPVSAAEPTKNTPFACNVCKRNYTRLDHLARHYRSHTQEKPFRCHTCLKTFARADLLKRHAASHSDRTDNKRHHSSPQPARVAQACIACATSKLKCGHEKPCRRCQQKGIACTFPAPLQRSRPSVQEIQPITQVLDLEVLEGAETLSSLERHKDLVRYPDGQHQTISMPAQPSDSFQKSLGAMRTPSSDAMHDSVLNDSPVLLDNGPVLDTYLAGFLNNAMDVASPNMDDFMSQAYPPRDIFNIGIDANLAFNDMDFGWINSQNSKAPVWNFNPIPEPEPALDQGQRTPDVRSSITAGAEAFERSLWRWAPQKQEHSYAEQDNLSLPQKDIQNLEIRISPAILDHRLEQNSRDRILVMLLSTSESANVEKIVTSFPSAEVLDQLMHIFFRSELSRTDTWIHLPTFRPQAQRPELNGIVVAAGAVLSSISTVRKLGFAIQEAVRLSLLRSCEKDNSRTRELGLLQTFALELCIGLWSGNKRKLELCESNSQPLITMLRRAGKFRRQALIVAPEPGDDEKILENKWRCWVEAESFKRLAFHTLIHDAQASIILLTRPLISYAEVSLELPCVLELWEAKSAQAWRDVYLRNSEVLSTRLPSLINCVHDIQPLSKIKDAIDLQFSTSVILHAIWSLIAEYRQLEFVLKIQSPESDWNGAMISASWHQELCQLMKRFRATVSRWEGGVTAESAVLQDLLLMNLHVSFEELQLFAGKEGSEEAQRVFPLLRQWYDSGRSRQAIYHAGQVFKAASSLPPNHLRDFFAVALYHCALCFWVWGVCFLGTSRSKQGSGPVNNLHGEAEELISLDGEDTVETRRFIAVGRGIPIIGSVGDNEGCRLDNPKAVMELIIETTSRNNGSKPPLVENLGQLMRDLGNAAGIIAGH